MIVGSLTMSDSIVHFPLPLVYVLFIDGLLQIKFRAFEIQSVTSAYCKNSYKMHFIQVRAQVSLSQQTLKHGISSDAVVVCKHRWSDCRVWIVIPWITQFNCTEHKRISLLDIARGSMLLILRIFLFFFCVAIVHFCALYEKLWEAQLNVHNHGNTNVWIQEKQKKTRMETKKI